MHKFIRKINQSGSYPCIYSLGWIHAYQGVYEVLQLTVRQLKADSYNVKVQTLVKRMCSIEF